MPKNKVLVVDDEPAIRYTLGEALKGWGYEHLEAGTISRALAFFESEHPLVVLQDIHLPDGSGLDALREYKSRQPQSVIIMMTGNVLVDDMLSALRGGAYDFVSKPIDPERLWAALLRWIAPRPGYTPPPNAELPATVQKQAIGRCQQHLEEHEEIEKIARQEGAVHPHQRELEHAVKMLPLTMPARRSIQQRGQGQ